LRCLLEAARSYLTVVIESGAREIMVHWPQQMPTQPSLFDSAPQFDRDSLRRRIRALADQQIFIGTSSWRYEGWLNQIYTPARYMTRGRFSKTKFHEEAIEEYADTFPIVGADFSFYAIPETPFWRKVFAAAPKRLKWDLKVPEEFTARRFSKQPRYGARAGHINPGFLDADAFRTGFLGPLETYLDRVGVFLIEFGTFSQASYPEPKRFADDLDAFLRGLPRGLRYAVEIRNDNFLDVSYFDVLKANGVAHIFNSWSRMPSLQQQILIDDAFTTSFTGVRALLRPGRAYSEAVQMFKPYTRIAEEYPSARQAIRDLIKRAKQDAISAFIHINNRLEGNAIQTIEAVVGKDSF
jgi:uncharacterized protein YecE (DUF72 family)